jgi:hypothetical protein
VRPLGIVPHQPRDQLPIEPGRIHEESGMEIHEFLLDRAVEPFDVRVHLRGLWVGVVVDQVEIIEFLGEVLHEFRAVVGKHEDTRVGKHHPAVLKELGCGQ